MFEHIKPEEEPGEVNIIKFICTILVIYKCVFKNQQIYNRLFSGPSKPLF
jgi:hypothetical protein